MPPSSWPYLAPFIAFETPPLPNTITHDLEDYISNNKDWGTHSKHCTDHIFHSGCLGAYQLPLSIQCLLWICRHLPELLSCQAANLHSDSQEKVQPQLACPSDGPFRDKAVQFPRIPLLSINDETSLFGGGGHLWDSGSKQYLEVWESWNLEGSQNPSLQYYISIRIAWEGRLLDLPNCLDIWRAPGYHFLWVSSGLPVMQLSLNHPGSFK